MIQNDVKYADSNTDFTANSDSRFTYHAEESDEDQEDDESEAKGKNHIILTGKVIFKNTDGFLSAEDRPVMMLYMATTIYFGLLVAYWTWLYIKDKSLLISLNYHILAIILFTFLESLLTYILYNLENNYSSIS